MVKLGVNIDHVATVRQARRESFPDPVELAKQAILGGAQGITAHLREDRRHIQDEDMFRLKSSISVPLNMEMAIHPAIIAIAVRLKPAWCCLVPENRAELTTEGGLDLKRNFENLKKAIQELQQQKIKISLFIDPDLDAVRLAAELKAEAIEIHTGPYARAFQLMHKEAGACSGNNLAARTSYEYELKKIVDSSLRARQTGLLVNAGHGLDYDNVAELTKSFSFNEFNIGFSIVARSLVVGMKTAVEEMIKDMASVCVES